MGENSSSIKRNKFGRDILKKHCVLGDYDQQTNLKTSLENKMNKDLTNIESEDRIQGIFPQSISRGEAIKIEQNGL